MSPDVEFCNIYTSPIFVATISGVMALAGVLLNQLSHLWGEKKRHERDVNLRLVESEIRKQENIQALQLQSLKELVTIYQGVLPNIWPSPNFESDDAYIEILYSMPDLMKQLDGYLKSFGYILPNKVMDKINMALYQCNEGHWGASTCENPAYEPSKHEVELAKGVLQSLSDSITIFKTCLGIATQDDEAQ
ncbi:MAG: hypothetical protein E6Q59_03175 [Nitrosomonas sp.]|uniref:hypothetical protein n=1 Tax=Nitrosomonas sp. TaxID=42353 RepID=UPI0011D9D11C|nr:MAG: hypothetical protein E6Q59_03175 [Nitrosomonas sp.]